MILVDYRIGSADLQGYLHHWHVGCELVTLEYGDAAFAGNGPQGPITVGVEIKKVHDALNCMGDGRFAGHQLPGLLANYERIWLVIEGNYKPDFASGLLLMPGERRREAVTGARRYMYRDLDNWLTSMEMLAGICVRRTGERVETARFVADLYGWWQKEWKDHHSTSIMHDDWRGQAGIGRIVKPNLIRRMAATLPGIGYQKSELVARRFQTADAMIEADVTDWMQIDGIGKKMAERIWNALHLKGHG